MVLDLCLAVMSVRSDYGKGLSLVQKIVVVDNRAVAALGDCNGLQRGGPCCDTPESADAFLRCLEVSIYGNPMFGFRVWRLWV